MSWSIFSIIFWILCSILSYSVGLAYLQREYEIIAKEDFHWQRNVCLVLSLSGPAFLIVLFFDTKFKHGFMFKWRNPHE